MTSLLSGLAFLVFGATASDAGVLDRGVHTPHPSDAVTSAWNDVASRLPPLPRDDGADPTLQARLDAVDAPDGLEALAEWITTHGLPDAGCAVLAEEGAPRTRHGVIHWAFVGEQLADHGEADAVQRIADDVHDREILGLAVARRLAAEPVAPEQILAALRREVRCTDTLVGRILDGQHDPAILPEARWVNLPRERWVYRATMARLLLDLEAADGRHEMIEVLETFDDAPDDARAAQRMLRGVVPNLLSALEPDSR